MKKLTGLLLAGAMCLGMAGCKEQEIVQSTDLTTEGPSNVLRVVTSYGGDDGNRAHFQSAVAAFEKEYKVSVDDRSAVSNEVWKNKVLTDFMTGSESDVLFYFVGADAAPLIHAGKVVSIEEIRKEYPEYGSNMVDAMMPAAGDGNHYALPSNGYWEHMFVNKEVLRKCGVPVPGPDYTWLQFLKDCSKIKDAGYTPLACSLAEIPHYLFEFAVLNQGSPEEHMELPQVDENGKLLDTPASRKWMRALEDIKALYEYGFFPKDTLTATDAQTVEMFAEGQAAFLIDGSWKVGFFTSNYADKMDDYAVSYVPGRGDRETTETIGGISMGYFITRKAWDNPETRKKAVDFVSYMTSDQVLSQFVTTEITALKNGAHPEGLNSLQKSAAAANQHVTGFVEAVQDTISSEAKSKLFRNIPKVVTGQMTAYQAVEEAAKLNQ